MKKLKSLIVPTLKVKLLNDTTDANGEERVWHSIIDLSTLAQYNADHLMTSS